MAIRNKRPAIAQDKSVSHQALAAQTELFLTACRLEGKTADTLRSYRETLALFLRAAHEIPLPEDVGEYTSANIYQFLGWVAATGVCANTQLRRQRETRPFFAWLERHEYIERNPFNKVKNIRVEQKVVQPFTQADIEKMMARRNPKTPKGGRDRALVLMLLDTGMRVGELAQTDLSDVDFEHSRVHIRHGKGNKQRIVAFGRQAKDALVFYIGTHRGIASGPLIQSCPGKRLTRTTIRGIVSRLGDEAGVPGVHPHRFRHTFAMWAIEQHARELDVQYLLGHSTSTMLRRYTATYNAEKAAQAHEMFSPGDRYARGRRVDFQGW
jgi:integrase/recombinase XerC/integrase/recombinase XerD